MDDKLKNLDVDKILKLAVVVGIVLLGLFVYYYVIFLPQKERARIDQQKQEQFTKEQKKQELQNCLVEANNWYNEAKQNTIKILEEEKKRYNPYQEFIDKNATSRDETMALLLEELEDYKAECFKKYPQK